MKYSLAILLLLLAPLMNAQEITGTWTGLLDTGAAKLNIVFHFQKDSSGKAICHMDSPDQSVKGIPASETFISADSVSISIPSLYITYRGKLAEGMIKGTFSQAGIDLSLDLKPGNIKRDRPQTPSEPYPYTTEEVTFTNTQAGVTLSGTLTYPVGYRPGDDVPAVVMVSGSGPQDRNSEIFDHKTFLVLADLLARAGIATLRYDDRGVGKSGGESLTANTAEVAQDAEAAVEFMRGLEKFSRTGVLGHSEGGCVAFMLAARGEADFMISMAGTGVRGDEVLYSQATRISALSGMEYPLTKEQFMETVRSQHNPWLDWFIDYDPAEDISKITCPALVLNGDKDVQVIADINIPAIKAALKDNPHNVVKIYPGLNHLFQPCTTGLPTEYAGISMTISPEVAQDIAEWIRSL